MKSVTSLVLKKITAIVCVFYKKRQLKMTFLKDRLHENQLYALDLAAEKGASSWLNTLPVKRYHFDLTKTEIRDGLALRYGWESLKIPAICPCGDTFSLAHFVQCNKEGYTQMRHDEIRDTLAAWMSVLMSKSSRSFSR